MTKTLKITDYGMSGAGIAHENGKTLFLPNVLLDEEIILDNDQPIIKKPSPHRVKPVCPYYFACGGCNLGCMDKTEQQNYKTIYVRNCFAKYKIDLPQKIEYFSKYQMYYRNKISFGVRQVNGKNVIGLFEANTHNIIEINECQIVDKRNKKLLEILREYLALDDVFAFDEQNNTGNIRNIVVRFCESGILLCIVGVKEIPLHLDKLYDNLVKEFKTVGLSFCENKNLRTILSTDITHLYGEKEIIINKQGLKVPVNIGSFVQVNDEVSAQLY
ncbi:MAG: class I SAM-dependent RNA methyltransferase, partial [Clostridia bacterium]|nr:class I SAM-dependent RNA methyltransferase [Clostridia bacterium]